MIASALLFLAYGTLWLLTWPIRQFSDVVLPSGITTALVTARGYLDNLNQVIPLTTLLAVLGIFVIIEASIFGYKGVMWIIKRIPFLN